MTRLPQVLLNVPGVDKSRADEDAVLAAAVAEEEAVLGERGPDPAAPVGHRADRARDGRGAHPGRGPGRRLPARRRGQAPAGARERDIRVTARGPRSYGHGVVDIEQINPRNQAALRAWWEVGHAATAERPGKPWPLWEQSRVALPADNPERGITLLGAIDGREMVGAGLLTRTLKENLHSAMAFAYARPDRTREGIGRALVARARGDRRRRRAYDDPERGLPPAGRLGRARRRSRVGHGLRRRQPGVDQGAHPRRLPRPPRGAGRSDHAPPTPTGSSPSTRSARRAPGRPSAGCSGC